MIKTIKIARYSYVPVNVAGIIESRQVFVFVAITTFHIYTLLPTVMSLNQLSHAVAHSNVCC